MKQKKTKLIEIHTFEPRWPSRLHGNKKQEILIGFNHHLRIFFINFLPCINFLILELCCSLPKVTIDWSKNRPI